MPHGLIAKYLDLAEAAILMICSNLVDVLISYALVTYNSFLAMRLLLTNALET